MKRIVKTRPKPKVADANHAQAKENIQTKMDALSSAVKRLSGPLVHVNDPGFEAAMAVRGLLPTTVRQFNQWSSDALPDAVRQGLPAFSRNANKTLHTAGLYEDVRRTVEAVRSLHVKAESEARSEKVATYKARAALAVKLREIAEDEIIRLKKELKKAKDEIDVLNRKLDQLRGRARKQSGSGDGCLGEIK